MAKGDDAAVDRVVADDPAVPALLDQPVARDDVRPRRGQGHKDLCDARLEFAAFAVHVDFATGRADVQPAQIEVGRVR